MPAQPAFPTAASVFGTPPQKSIFGTPIVPTPSLFQFGAQKLQFGSPAEEPSKPPLFKFGSQSSKGKDRAEKEKEKKKEQPSKPTFSIGSAGGPLRVMRSQRRGKQKPSRSRSVSPSSKADDKTSKPKEEEKESSPETEEPLPPPLALPHKQALSPAIAECQRAVYAAFLWQEGLVHDAIASASYLKFHPELSKEMKIEPKTEKKVPQEEKGKEGEEEKGKEGEQEEGEEEKGKEGEQEEGEEEKGKEGEKEEGEEEKGKEGEQEEGEEEKGKEGELEEGEEEKGKEGEQEKKEEGEQEKGGGEAEGEGEGEGDQESEKVGGDKDSAGKEGEQGMQEKAEVAEGKEPALDKNGSSKPPSLVLTSASDTRLDVLSLPPTLNHLVTFWDEISTKVLNNSSVPFPPPKVPAVAQELLKRYEEEKKEIEKRKKAKDKKAGPQAGGGSTICELCDQSFPDPVTYHMKEVHPGCGKHASGWGYNSRGTFCSGWAGNCGDGGRGGSTWYLMCKDCHSKYLAMKDEVKKKAVKTIPLPKMKTKKPGKPRSFPVLSAVQGMIQNAKFLLEISCPVEKPATTPTALQSPGSAGFSKQASFPGRADSLGRDSRKLPPSFETMPWEKPSTEQRPAFLRSISLAAKSSERPSPLRSQSSDIKEESPLPRQRTMDNALSGPEQHTAAPLVFKPSYFLARLMYNRSKHSTENKEVGYRKVLAFVLRYHDLNGLRVTMKQSMRVAGVRAFAMEVG